MGDEEASATSTPMGPHAEHYESFQLQDWTCTVHAAINGIEQREAGL